MKNGPPDNDFYCRYSVSSFKISQSVLLSSRSQGGNFIFQYVGFMEPRAALTQGRRT